MTGRTCSIVRYPVPVDVSDACQRIAKATHGSPRVASELCSRGSREEGDRSRGRTSKSVIRHTVAIEVADARERVVEASDTRVNPKHVAVRASAHLQHSIGVRRDSDIVESILVDVSERCKDLRPGIEAWV